MLHTGQRLYGSKQAINYEIAVTEPPVSASNRANLACEKLPSRVSVDAERRHTKPADAIFNTSLTSLTMMSSAISVFRIGSKISYLVLGTCSAGNDSRM